MTTSIFGQVVGVKKFANGDIQIDFYHDEKITEFRYSSDVSRLGDLPKELAETMASTLATEICIEISFDENGIPLSIDLEECDDEDDLEDEEEIDEDFVTEES